MISAANLWIFVKRDRKKNKNDTTEYWAVLRLVEWCKELSTMLCFHRLHHGSVDIAVRVVLQKGLGLDEVEEGSIAVIINTCMSPWLRAQKTFKRIGIIIRNELYNAHGAVSAP